MATRLATDAFVIEKYALEERCAEPKAGVYTICRVDVADSLRAAELLAQGYAFLDRVLLMEIDLRRPGEREAIQAMPGVRVVCDHSFPEEMFSLACRAYTMDRRFHLEPAFDSVRAAPVLRAYIDDCAARGMKVYKALHGEELLGFTVVDESLPGVGRFENVLGATTPGIKGKMVAPMLYNAMLEGEKARFRKFIGRVSAGNAASMNLHYSLGARTLSVYDEYIHRPK